MLLRRAPLDRKNALKYTGAAADKNNYSKLLCVAITGTRPCKARSAVQRKIPKKAKKKLKFFHRMPI